MKRRLAIRMLPLTALLALGPVVTAPASGEKSLPDFTLNSKRASHVYRYNEDGVPVVPPPTDTGYYAGGRPGGVRLESSIKVVVEGETGRAEINFPGAGPDGAPYGFRSSLFVKFAANSSASVLSWASVVCSGRQYLGYKGSSLKLPGGAGDFVIKDETLSLGPLKSLLGRTHPWLLPASEAGNQALDGLCSADFPKKMKAYAVKALPREADGFSFKYDPVGNLLTVTWSK